jgi:hypothetical protein
MKITQSVLAEMQAEEASGLTRAQIAAKRGLSGASVTRALGAKRAYRSRGVTRGPRNGPRTAQEARSDDLPSGEGVDSQEAAA